MKNIYRKIGPILEFEILFRLFSSIICIPIIWMLIKINISITGGNYLSLESIKLMLKNPLGILLIIATLIFFALVAICEISGLIKIYYFSFDGMIPERKSLISSILQDIKRIFINKNYKLIIWMLLIMPISGTISGVIPKLKIPGYIFDTIIHNPFYLVGSMFGIFMAFYLFIKGIFLYNGFFYDGLDFSPALKQSKKLLKGHGVKITVLILITSSITLFVGNILSILGVAITEGLFAGTSIGTIKLALLFAIVKFLKIAFPFIGSVLAIFLQVLIICYFYRKYKKEKKVDITSPLRISVQKRNSILMKHRRYTALVIIILIMVNSFFAVSELGSNLSLSTHKTKITSHRGGALFAPENTLAAIEKSIEKGADYAEIDVQLTKDKKVILLHDKTFSRTCDVNKKPRDVTYDKIKHFDAGSHFSHTYSDEKVPLLEDVIKASKRKIKLNIELKPYDNNKKELAEAVCKIVKENQFQNDCVISSLDEKILNQVKEFSPKLTVGLILPVAQGDFYDTENIDFFSIEESFVSKDVIYSAHRLGKQIHVWTINDDDSMFNIYNLGVDNIITDDPALALVERYKYESEDPLVTLLKKYADIRSY